MGNRKNRKRKGRNSSDTDPRQKNNKQQKYRGPSGEEEETDEIASVSSILNLANSVLYGDTDVNSFVFETHSLEPDSKEEDNRKIMAESSAEPTNRDLMNCLKGISGRLSEVEKKLTSLDKMEKRMCEFEKEIKSIWHTIDSKVKKVDDRVVRLEDRMETTEIETVSISSKVDELERERESLRSDLAYIKAQSMRNNLIFTSVPEDNTNGVETPETTERILRQHLQDALKVAKESVEKIQFERVHRTPGEPQRGKIRHIVAKFTLFKDREHVRKQWKNLQGTNFRVFEQFPPEVVQKRRRLVPKMKEARRDGKRAWLSYDTLYVDGVAVRD